jgi:hypothetical protein
MVWGGREGWIDLLFVVCVCGGRRPREAVYVVQQAGAAGTRGKTPLRAVRSVVGPPK